MDRKITFSLLANLLETHINPNNDSHFYWAKEVIFDYASKNRVKVDYMTFAIEDNTISGIEKGEFGCYEIITSVEDFRSKNGHSFIGDFGYYVMPRDVYNIIKSEIPYDIGVYCSNENFTELKIDTVASRTGRERTMLEMLFTMFRSVNRDRNTTPLSKDNIAELIKQAKEKTQQHGYWICERVSEKDWDGGHTNYYEYTCSVCGHTEKYKGTKKCYHCRAIMDGVMHHGKLELQKYKF